MNKLIALMTCVLMAGFAFSGVTTHFALDTRTGVRELPEESVSIRYDASWYESGALAKVEDNGTVVESGQSGYFSWLPTDGEAHTLTLNVFDGEGSLVGSAMAKFGLGIKSVEARQRYPWNGLVDITVVIKGAVEDVLGTECYFAATDGVTKVAIPIVHISRNGADTGSGVEWVRHFVWDAAADLGEVRIGDIVLAVGVNLCGGVQLWENGPCWAECNVGANQPEEYGYYFWWGDTVGYKRNANNDGWISVKDLSAFPFSVSSCPTFGKNNSLLRSAGYVDATGNLAAKYDAATAHLGAPWRMPTDAELSALINNCTTTGITRNGVNGRLVTGKGAYASKSIFLPVAGGSDGSNFISSGLFGYYWSSTPKSSDPDCAYFLTFGLDDGNFLKLNYDRNYGHSVRPVRNLFVSWAVTTHFALDTRMGVRELPEESVSIRYDASWYESGVLAKIEDNGEMVASGASGNFAWLPTGDSAHTLRLNVFDGAGFLVGSETAKFGIYAYEDNGDGTITLTGANVASGDLIIPSSIDGKRVTSIGENAFQLCDGLTSVTMPSGVVYVAATAFAGCENISAVTLGCTMLDKWTDEYEPKIVSTSKLVWPGLQLDQLREEFIGYISGDCIGKPNETYASGSHVKRTAEGVSVQFQMVADTLVKCVGVLFVQGADGVYCKLRYMRYIEGPENYGADFDVDQRVADYYDYDVSKIRARIAGGPRLQDLFPDAYAKIKNVVIRDGVTSIEACEFYLCSGLESVTIPSSMTSIGNSAFYGCDALKTISVSGNGDIGAIKRLLSESGLDIAGLTFYHGEMPVAFYTVTFNATGGAASVASKEVEDGAAIGTLPSATWSGYTFLGWFTAASGGTQVTAATVVTADVTWYAHWEKIGGGGDDPVVPVTPTIKFDGSMYGWWAEDGESEIWGYYGDYGADPESSDWADDFVDVGGDKEPGTCPGEGYAFPVTITPGTTFTPQIVEASTDATFATVSMKTDAEMLAMMSEPTDEDGAEWWVGHVWPNGRTDSSRAWVVVLVTDVPKGDDCYTFDLTTKPIADGSKSMKAYAQRS